MRPQDGGGRSNRQSPALTQRLVLTTWDLHRQWARWGESSRARVMLLRSHQRLQEEFDAARHVPRDEAAILKVSDQGETGCLLIHGILGSPGTFRGLADRLHGAGLTVYAPPMPVGEHLGPFAGQFLWRACMEDIQQRYRLLEETCRRVHVVGHGFGAALAVHLARRSSPTSLVLLAPAIVPRVSLIERTFLRMKLHRLPWLRPRFGWTPEVLEAMERARSRLGRLKLPVYAAQCDDDARISPISLRLLQKRARHRSSRFRVYPEGGHELLDVHGRAGLYDEILSFFRSLK